MITAPDLAVPVSAWRLWHLTEGDDPELVAPARRTPWPARTATTATCGAGCTESPGPWCQCGLYALTGFPTWARWGREDVVAIGCTALWGRVIEAERGWRAERGYPLVLLLPCLSPEPDPDLAMPRADRASTALQYRLSGLFEDEESPLLDRPAAARTSRRLAERYAIPVHPLPIGPPWTHSPDDVVELRAATVRDEAAAGLAARRAGDPAARDRLDRAVAGLSAALTG